MLLCLILSWYFRNTSSPYKEIGCNIVRAKLGTYGKVAMRSVPSIFKTKIWVPWDTIHI